MAPQSASAARTGGKLLLVSAAATALMVAARVAADADQPTLTESLQAIADSRPVYALHSAGRLIAGLTLLASAWYLFHSPIARINAFGQLTVYLLGASGLITTISAACTIVLAAYPAPGADIPSFIEGISHARWLTGKIGFTVTGLALLAAPAYLWGLGGSHLGSGYRAAAVATAVLGIAMQFIWVDAATVMHRIIGVALLLWLIAAGVALTTGLIDRHTGKSSDPDPSLPTHI